MQIDFLTEGCKGECNSLVDYACFGLCDDTDIPPEPPTPAYVLPYHEHLWVATIINEQRLHMCFTAIDHCLIRAVDGGEPRPSACDCMLTYNDVIIFVELKDRQGRGWLEDGLGQLRSTIELFLKIHGETTAFMHRRAYLSNATRPALLFPLQRKNKDLKI